MEATKPLPHEYDASQMFTNPWVISVLTVLDDDKLDREWIVRNVLGGMATGFGLRGTCGYLHGDVALAAKAPCP